MRLLESIAISLDLSGQGGLYASKGVKFW